MFPIRDVNPTRVTAVVTLVIIAVNVLVFFVIQPRDAGDDVEFLYRRAAIACELTSGEPLTFPEIRADDCSDRLAGDQPFPDKPVRLSVFVSMFLHGGLLHLLGNMWFLYLFGDNVEEAYGRLRYLAVYLIAGIAATIGYVALHPDSTVPLVGASGAIAGVLGSYLVLFPRQPVVSLVFFYLLPVPAVLFLGLWFIGQFLTADPGIAWEAHVAGFVAGAVISAIFRAPLLRRVRKLHGPRRAFAGD